MLLTGAGVERPVVVPSPSCPYVLSPQHEIDMSLLRAQVYCSPAAISTTPERPGTSAGDPRQGTFVPVLSRQVDVTLAAGWPSWPLALLPQHETVPSACSTHVWLAPPVIWAQSLIPGTFTGEVEVAEGVPVPSSPSTLRPQHQAWPL